MGTLYVAMFFYAVLCFFYLLGAWLHLLSNTHANCMLILSAFLSLVALSY